MVFVISLRPISTSVYKNLLQSSGVHLLKLSRLNKEDCAAVVTQTLGINFIKEISLNFQILGVNSVPPKILDVIMNKAQGNPFLAEQISNTLREQETFKVVFGQIVMENDLDLTKINIPDNLQSIILSRIDR